MMMISTIKMKLMIILISNLNFPNKIFDILEQDIHLQKCNIIANICVGLDVNILHCVKWLG